MTEQRQSAGFRDTPVFHVLTDEELRERAKGTVDLAVTPNGRRGDASPLARPGYSGPRRLSNYEREIAHALMRKGKSKSQAIRMARGLLKKAAARGKWGDKGKAGAKTRAGAAASIAQRKTF